MNSQISDQKEFLFTSQRLGFRLICENDLEDLIKLDSDPDVTAFFPMGMLDTEQVKNKIKQNLELYNDRQFCIFIAVDLASGKFAGRCGFDLMLDTNEIEVGYVFLKEFWGKGLATEALRALLHWAKTNISTEKIIAFTPAMHVISQRVMEKCGMRYYKNEVMYGVDCKFYKVNF